MLRPTPVYNHVSTCDSTSNGTKAWKILTDFYEGEVIDPSGEDLCSSRRRKKDWMHGFGKFDGINGSYIIGLSVASSRTYFAK